MSRPEQASLKFEDKVIDFAGHRLLCGGVEQPLEPKAFAVLALLVSELGRVLNRVMTLLRIPARVTSQHTGATR